MQGRQCSQPASGCSTRQSKLRKRRGAVIDASKIQKPEGAREHTDSRVTIRMACKEERISMMASKPFHKGERSGERDRWGSKKGGGEGEGSQAKKGKIKSPAKSNKQNTITVQRIQDVWFIQFN
eukprot:3884264-Rhodomonas_salina.2